MLISYRMECILMPGISIREFGMRSIMELCMGIALILLGNLTMLMHISSALYIIVFISSFVLMLFSYFYNWLNILY